MRRTPRLVLTGLAAAAISLPAAGAVPAATAAAASSTFAPVDRPGPPLDVPAAKLRASLRCGARTSPSDRSVVLLVPGTNLDPQSNFGWNYIRAFREYAIPYCTVTLPHHTMGDVQTAGEYVVHAIRTIARRSGHKVDILGYSQGGMLPRWALRWWPDTRRLVDDVVALDPSNHGTLDAQAVCRASCPPAYWQQATNAHFYAALNSRAETFRGVDYTVIYSHTDEIVVPNTDASGSSALHTGDGTITNIAVQDICPGDVSDHLAMGSYDPVGYALAVDAFNHPGVAKASRIDPSVCTAPYQPGVDPQTFATDYAQYLGAIGQAAAESPETSSEPPLACYVYTSPPKGCAK